MSETILDRFRTTRRGSGRSLHKIRNVESYLPDRLAATVATKMRAAYHDTDPLSAEATLEASARDLDKAHPAAAGSP